MVTCNCRVGSHRPWCPLEYSSHTHTAGLTSLMGKFNSGLVHIHLVTTMRITSSEFSISHKLSILLGCADTFSTGSLLSVITLPNWTPHKVEVSDRTTMEASPGFVFQKKMHRAESHLPPGASCTVGVMAACCELGQYLQELSLGTMTSIL